MSDDMHPCSVKLIYSSCHLFHLRCFMSKFIICSKQFISHCREIFYMIYSILPDRYLIKLIYQFVGKVFNKAKYNLTHIKNIFNNMNLYCKYSRDRFVTSTFVVNQLITADFLIVWPSILTEYYVFTTYMKLHIYIRPILKMILMYHYTVTNYFAAMDTYPNPAGSVS